MAEKYLATFHANPARSHSSSTENLSRSHEPPAKDLPSEKTVYFQPPHRDFDPCENAKPCSPFYNHDSPRPSTDQQQGRPDRPLHVAVRDLESQNTPGSRQEAGIAGGSDPSPGGEPDSVTENSRFHRVWASCAERISGKKQQQSNGKPKQMIRPKTRSCSCMSKLPARQRLLVKLFIVLLIIGVVVGIGVGISLRVGGEVYKDDRTTSKVGEA